MAMTIFQSPELSLDGVPTELGRQKLKVLVIDEEVPLPPNSGKRIRTWNLLRRLAARHEVTLLCYGEACNPAIPELERVGIRVKVVPPSPTPSKWKLYLQLLQNLLSPLPFSVVKHYSRRFQEALDGLLREERWDVLQCEWTPYMHFVGKDAPCPVLIATHNVEYQIWQRRASHDRNVLGKLFFYLQAAKMRRFEKIALKRAASVTAVSTVDARMMAAWGVKNIAVVSNGIDAGAYRGINEPEAENEVVSISSLDWYPNVDAIDFFLRAAWPMIRREQPQAVFRVIGRNPPEELRKRLESTAGVVFHGEVADLHPFLQKASVVVVPLRIGGGSRLKILEALGAGKAVVSTTVGAEGLELTPDVHLWIADEPEDFARKTVELLRSPVNRKRLGDIGRSYVQHQYDWDKIAVELEASWQQLSAHVAKARSSKRAGP
jgi:glycosyltransferase involved in cell wall biosynthesis